MYVYFYHGLIINICISPCTSASTSAYEKIQWKWRELDGADVQPDLDSYTALCIARNDPTVCKQPIGQSIKW